MNLLAAVNYDPTGAAAVSKATTALLAMTALDTTNLRVTFTVPLSGRVWVRVSGGGLHGAATYPVILVGILSGATVVARHQPIVTIGGAAAATTPGQVFCEFVVPGLTPGTATTWDLAYGVEQVVALTGWKYGGPNNNTTAGDAFGGIAFEVYDPNPIYLPGAMPTATVQANEASVIANQGTLATSVAAVKTKTDSLTFTTALKVDAAMNAAADLPQAAADKVWSTAARTLTAQADTSGTTTLLARVPALVPVATDYTAARAAKLDNLDVVLSTRGTSTYAGGAVASVTGSVGSVASYGTLVADMATAVWGAVTRTLTASLDPSAASIADAVWNRLTSAIVTASSIGKLLVDNLNATVSSRSTYAGTDTPGTTTLLARATAPTAAVVAAAVWDESLAGHTTAGTAGKTLTTAGGAAAPSAATVAAAVWDEPLAGHATAGSAGKTLSSAGSAGDPWGTLLPGAYAAGTAGKIIGANLDAQVSTRASATTLTTRADAIDAALGTSGGSSVTEEIQSVSGAITPPSRRRLSGT